MTDGDGQDMAGGDAGHEAKRPSRISPKGWWAVMRRVFRAVLEDRLGILSAGIAFYLFLSIFPALAVFVSVYGMMVDRQQAVSQVDQLTLTMPAEVREILGHTAAQVVEQSDEHLGWGVLLSAFLGIWSAKKGTNALFDGVGIAYNERDERGIVKKTLLTLAATAVLIAGGLLAIGLLTLIPAVTGWLGLPEWLAGMAEGLRWPVLAGLVMVVLAWLYRIAPDRRDARWRWITPGSVLATLLWLGGSAAFSWYFENFGNLDRTFGTFGAAALLMLWLMLTAFVILVGAELNAELEHHVRPDSTVAPDRPLGERGAWVADHVANASQAEVADDPGGSPEVDRAK